MKKYFLLFAVLWAVTMFACQKEPPKGNYIGKFEGSYTDTAKIRIIYYTTNHEFEVTKSTNSEVHLKEASTQMTSILQKANDSITGKIGFGKIYNPSSSGNSVINTITIRGKYYKEEKKISGAFSTIILSEGAEYPSRGTFVLQSY